MCTYNVCSEERDYSFLFLRCLQPDMYNHQPMLLSHFVEQVIDQRELRQRIRCDAIRYPETSKKSLNFLYFQKTVAIVTVLAHSNYLFNCTFYVHNTCKYYNNVTIISIYLHYDTMTFYTAEDLNGYDIQSKHRHLP